MWMATEATVGSRNLIDTLEHLRRNRRNLCMSHNLKLIDDTSRCRPHRSRHNQHRTCSIHRPDCHRLLEGILAQSYPTVSIVTNPNRHCRSLLAAVPSMPLTRLRLPNWRRRCGAAQGNSTTFESLRGPTGRFHQHYMCPTRSRTQQHHWTRLTIPCSSTLPCECWRRSGSCRRDSDRRLGRARLRQHPATMLACQG